MTELEDQVSDFRRCVPDLVYYGDVSEEAFGLPVEQMRPFGVRVVAYTQRDDLKHLEARGVISFFMGPGDGPRMDRVCVKSTTKSTVRQYRHVVTPRVCVEEYAMKFQCSELHTSSDMSDEHVLADQQEMPDFERGLFEVDARDPDEVLPYTDEPFIDREKAIAAFGTVRAVPPDPTRRTVGKRGVNVQWQAGEHPTISERHNQPGTALHNVEHPREHWPEDAVKSPPYGPALLFARDATRSTPEVAAGVVAETCERMLSLWEPDLGPTWGFDVEHPPAPDAHVGAEECICTVHRDRCVLDCADTGMQIDWKLLWAPRYMWDPTVGPGDPEGSHSDTLAEAPSEPASPPHSDAMVSAGSARGGGGCCGLWFARGGGAHGC